MRGNMNIKSGQGFMARGLSASHLGSQIFVMSELAGIIWSVGDFSEILKLTWGFWAEDVDMWRSSLCLQYLEGVGNTA